MREGFLVVTEEMDVVLQLIHIHVPESTEKWIYVTRKKTVSYSLTCSSYVQDNKHNSLHLSNDKEPCIFSRQMQAIVYSLYRMYQEGHTLRQTSLEKISTFSKSQYLWLSKFYL